jgi:transcriptional regulator GlxA family with amidase domain
MLRRLSEPLSLARLAASLHVSPSTLSHRFRRETGLSPMQALIGLRLNKAQALLRTGMTLEEIARQTGFCDAFHLSKSYKRRHGALQSANSRRDIRFLHPVSTKRECPYGHTTNRPTVIPHRS